MFVILNWKSLIKEIELSTRLWSRWITGAQPLCGQDEKSGISLLKYSSKDTTSIHIPHGEKVNGEQWRQLERARTELMRGNKIHSSLQFQGWRSWDLRKGPESGWRREVLNERHYGRRKPHYTICALRAGAGRKKKCKACSNCVQQVGISWASLDSYTLRLFYCHRMQRPCPTIV